MKKIITLICCAFISTAMAFAAKQGDATLRGRVLDIENNEPAGWATVSLMTADSVIVAGTACNENGEYELRAAAGEYTLTASLIGYRDKSFTVRLVSGVNEQEPIGLEPDAQMLEGASVTERVKLVEMKIDKVVMNVRESAFAQGSNALELIKKAPGVTVDKDGNVKLNGKPVSVWIDGRPSYMDGKTLETLLRSTNGESIDKFELMEHPSSKYDAAGQGGIINIKTRRNLLQGFNGSVGLGGGGMRYGEEDTWVMRQNFWANLAYRTEKTNTFVNISEDIDNEPIKIINDLTLDPLGFRQVGTTFLDMSYRNYNIKLGNDWFIDDKNTVGIIANIPGGVSLTSSRYSVTDQYLGGQLVSETVAGIKNGPSRSLQSNLNLNYTHIFNEALASEITANVDYYHNSSNELNTQADTTVSLVEKIAPVYASKVMDAKYFYDIYSAKADYQGVVAQRFMLETGAKWALSSTDNNSLETETLVPDRVTDFVYREHVGAAYAALSGQLSPKVSFKAGLRGEYTNSFGDWISSGTETRRDYFDLFPTLYLGYQPTENWRLSGSLTRRIQRPGYGQLNPTKMYVDAKTYTLGNPDILPQYNMSYSLSAGYGQHLSVALSYDHAYNVINQIPSYDASGIQYLTWGNFGVQNVGAAIFSLAALPIGSWLQWTVNTAGLYIGATDSYSGAMTESYAFQGYSDFTFLLPKDWKVDLDFQYQSPMSVAYFRVHRIWYSNLAVKKNLLSDRMTLTFKLDDIFRSMKNNIDIVDVTGAGAFTALQQIYFQQCLSFDITWNFGKAQKPLRQRAVGNLEEISRAAGSSGSVGK